MVKKIGIGIVILVLLSGMGYIFHDLYFYGSFFSQYRIQSDPLDFNNYPYLRLNDITSGKLSTYLHKQINNNQITLVSESTKPFAQHTALDNSLFEDRGINYGSPLRDVGSYNDTEKPYHFVAYFKTGINRKVYSVYVLQVKNIDNTNVFIPLIIDDNLLFVDSGPTEYFSYLTKPDLNNFPSPVLVFKDQDSCSKTYPNYVNYCSWFLKNKKIQNKSKLIFEDLVKNSVYNKEVEKIPFLVKLVLYK